MFEVLGRRQGIVIRLVEVLKDLCDITGLQCVLVFFHVEEDQFDGCLQVTIVILEVSH